MAGLRECMKFASRMSDAEADDLINRVDAYIASGIAPAEAQRAATNDMLAELEQERQEIVALAEEQNAPVKASRAEIQAQAKALGLPATGPSSQIERLINIVESSPTEWTREDLDLIAPHLSVHQDLRPGAEDRISAILSDGLRAGMVDSVGNMLRGDVWTWSRGLKGVPAYVFISGALKYKPGGNPRLAPGNKPLFAVTPAKGQEFFDALKTAVRPVDAADEVQFSQSTNSRQPQAGPGFYSALRRAVADAKTNASPAEYWSNLIKGAVSKGTVKQDEVKWSGINDWIAGQEGKIKKADVLAWIDDNGVTVGETVEQPVETQTPANAKKPDELREAAVALYADGVASGTVASQLGLSETTVLRWVRDAGITRTVAETKGVTTDKLDEAVRLYSSGESVAKAASAAGIGGSTLHRVLKSRGLSRDLASVRDTPQEVKDEALGLYSSGMNTYEVADALGLTQSTVSTWAREAGVSRGYSGAQALRVALGRIEGRGIKTEFVSDKNDATLFAASVYELARMHQLESDASVVSYSRSTDRVPYGDGQTYVPDLRVKYADGREVVEEIKPQYQAKSENVTAKADAATTYFKSRGIEYRLITESDIGLDGFDAIDPEAAAVRPEDVKRIKGTLATIRWALRKMGAPAKVADEGLPMFSQSTNQQPQATWDGPVKSRWDSLVYQTADKQIDLKRVTEILRASGVKLTDRGDAYLREELWVSRAADKIKRFETNHILPLMTEMRAAGVDMKELGTYLHARHAEEANIELKAMNKNRADNEALSGMSTPDARKILAAAKPVMPRLAARVDAMLESTRHLMEMSGLETAETVQALRDAYKYYVPLHRDEAHPDSHTGSGQGFSVPGSVVRKRVGSNAKVTPELILPHIFAAYEMVVSKAEKNLVGQAIYHMALTNPNSNWWKTDSPPTVGVKDERKERFNPGTGQMEANPNYGQVVFRTDPNYKRADNVLVIRVNGQDRSVQFEETNERAMRMAAALKNLDTLELQLLQRTLGTATRWMAAFNTKYNPVFTIVNAFRDLQGAAVNLTTTEIAGAQAEVLNPLRLSKIAREVYRMEQGKPPADPVVAGWVDTFRARGGATGFRQVYSNIEDRGKELEARMKRLGRGGVIGKGQEFLDFVGAANDAVENMIRVSAFQAALDRGLSPDRAASLAKNITVNFNRKGATFGQFMGTAYMFFNAAIQGNARTFQTLTKGKAAKYIVSAGLMMGVAQALLTAAFMDEDDDENSELLPGYARRTSWIIPYAKDKYIQIPMPLGLHVVPNVGRILAEAGISVSRGDGLQVSKRVMDLMSVVLDSVNPLGGTEAGITQMLTPSVAKPVVQLEQNKGGLGGPIYKDRMPGDAGAPGYTLKKDSTSPHYQLLAEGIHRIFHDPDVRNTELPAWTSPQPEALRLIPESIFGGVWRETEKLFDTIHTKAKGEELDTKRIILLSRFSGDLSDPSAPTEAYYKAIDAVGAAHRGAKRAAEAGRDVTGTLHGLQPQAERTKRTIRQLTDSIRELTIEGGNEAEIRELEKEKGEIMLEWIKTVREVRREPATVE